MNDKEYHCKDCYGNDLSCNLFDLDEVEDI